MLTIRAMSDGKGYAARHLQHNDYYSESELVVGRWYGRGAEMVGLCGDVDTKDFDALRQGFDSQSGEFLRQRRSADRVGADGETVSHARSLYDFTISAPKSVSIMATLGRDARLADAHKAAVEVALEELEGLSATRVRQGGANGDRRTGNLILAVYHHDASRELDPQLHTHAVAANLTFDGVEDRWKALQASGIYERRAYLTEIYRNALACNVRKLGYEIENRRDAKGHDAGFEIAGVSEALLIKFSQRSQQRDAAIREFVEKSGRQPSDNEVAVLVRESRPGKLVEISSDELRNRQRQRLKPAEASGLEGLRPYGVERALMAEPAEPSLRYAKEHIFERVSVARDHEILTEALRHGRGCVETVELKRELARQETHGDVLRDGSEVATMASLQRERAMIAAVNGGIGSSEPLGGERDFRASDSLRAEQRQAVEFVLASRDLALNIRGAAGTGKTAMLRELRRGLIEGGREVLAIAPTMSAVEELQKVGFQDAVTVQRLLQDQKLQTNACGRVLIVDEAGMISARQMSDLHKLAESRSAQIVFSGDTKQISSVEAGDALRVLERESRLKTVTLTQVQRQVTTDYRDAIQALRRNPQLGFAKLEAIGAVREVPSNERAELIAKAYTEAPTQNALVVCATHEEIGRITEAIRSERKRSGALRHAVRVERDVSLRWTTAQKQELRNFRPGQILGFHREIKGIAKNEAVKVVSADAKRLVVRNPRGETHTVTARHAKSFDVLERQEIEVAVGDRLLLTTNRRDDGFRCTNGEIVTVASIDGRGRVSLEDGRTLAQGFRQFTHGYAVTAHRSQGKTVDSVIISGDRMQKELFYVAASRGRRNVLVFTSNREALRESVATSAQRKSASELARQTRTRAHRGERRGLAAARELVHSVSKFVKSIPGRIQRRERQAEQLEWSRERSHEYSIGR